MPIILIFNVLCIFLFLSNSVLGGELENRFEEIQSNATETRSVSEKIIGKDSRLVPVPIPVANPTIGTGLAVAILYMHSQKSEESEAPTSITGAFGLYTDSKSWAAGAFHDGYYLDDRIRFRAPITHGEFHLKFYGIGAGSRLRDNPIKYQAIGNLFVPRLTFELPWNNWFLGGQYRLISVDAKFETSDSLPEIPGSKKLQTAGLGLVSLFDSRDSNLWPSRGSWLDITAIVNGEYVGGDFSYLKAIVKWAQYFPIKDSFTLVYRLDGQFIDGDAPFWDLSTIRLRGYSGGQFLDNIALTAQAEVRWNFYKRLTAVAFGGGGCIADEIDEIGSANTNFAGGVGLGYMIVPKQKLSVGIDVAYSEDAKVSVYFQVGDWLAN